MGFYHKVGGIDMYEDTIGFQLEILSLYGYIAVKEKNQHWLKYDDNKPDKFTCVFFPSTSHKQMKNFTLNLDLFSSTL